MKKWIRENLVFLSLLFFVCVTILTLNSIKIPYDLTCPGEVHQVQRMIEIDESNKSSGSFNTISVYSHERISVLKYLLSFLHPSLNVEKSSEIIEYNYNDMVKSGTIQKEVSINNALIAAYNYTGNKLNFEYLGLIIDRVTIYTPNNIEIGDIIVSFNGEMIENSLQFEELVKNSPQEFNTVIIRNNELTNINSKFRYNVKKDNNEYPYMGISYYEHYKINQDSANPAYSINKTNTLGPSGGLMQALMIVDSLLEEDLTKGLKIAGTGEIEADGSVGEIGGMYQKIFTAYYNKVDICFVPVFYQENGEIDLEKSNNYREALRAYDDLNKPKSLKIVPVTTLTEAVTYLRGGYED